MGRGRRSARHAGVALALLATSLASPADAAPLFLGAPPWTVEAPGAAEARFNLGSEAFFERQQSLRITAFEQLVGVVDLLSGTEQSSRLPGDPALLNRKFDLIFERQGIGPLLSVALPSGGFPNGGRLYPTLAFEAAGADVSLDFHDVTQPQDSTSLRGRGALFETRLDLVTTLCPSCPWFAATGYRFEKLPSLAVDRSPRFAVEGFTVPRDEVRLGRQVQEVSTRVGYTAPGGRTASFIGVQHRWTDLEIDDRLTYRDALSETRLSSRTRLESQTTLAVAGVDVALGGRLFSRLQTAVGDGDSLVWLGLMYVPSTPSDRVRERAAEIARTLAPVLAGLRERFRAAWAQLQQSEVDGTLVYSRAQVDALLDGLEVELLAELSAPELAAMRDSVRDRLRQSRRQLDVAVASLAAAPPRAASTRPAASMDILARPRLVLYRPAARLLASTGSPTVGKETADRTRAEDDGLLARLVDIFFGNDLVLDLCLRSEPVAGAKLVMYPEGYPSGRRKGNTNNRLPDVFRGKYLYDVTRSGYKTIRDREGIDYLYDSRPYLVCALVPEASAQSAEVCSQDDGDMHDCPRR